MCSLPQPTPETEGNADMYVEPASYHKGCYQKDEPSVCYLKPLSFGVFVSQHRLTDGEVLEPSTQGRWAQQSEVIQRELPHSPGNVLSNTFTNLLSPGHSSGRKPK